MIEKLESNQIPDFIEIPSSKESNPTGSHPDIDADVSIDVNYASFIERAMQIPETDDTTIQLAREILISGKLASPENTRKAAEYIIDFGI